MKKLRVCYLFLLCSATVQYASAQTGINKISITGSAENTSPQFIEGISFTPDGILKTSERSEIKSVKSNLAATGNRNNTSLNTENSSIEKISPIQFKYAMMLDVDVESLKNLSLFGYIEDWFGTRYRYGGTTKQGIDCSALTDSLLLAVYGFSLPRTARQQYRATKHITKDELKEGDLVFFNTHGGVSHVGLYLDNHYFVHASSSQGVTISSLDEDYYSKRFICGGRVENE